MARSFEKIRQAAGGMPAVLIRQLDALSTIMAVAPAGRTQVLLDQAAMIQRVSLRTVPEPADQADIAARYDALLALHATRQAGAERTGGESPAAPVRTRSLLHAQSSYTERTLGPRPGQESTRRRKLRSPIDRKTTAKPITTG